MSGSGSERHARASELFLALRALGPDERETELAALAGRGERELADEVRSLLAYDAHEPGTLDEGDERDEAGTTGPTSTPLSPSSRGKGTAGSTGTTGPELPERLGPYRVVERIGRGSSGHVFLAEQDEPVRRRVAIKVVPQAALDPELAARFEVERRALEQASHPNVARLVDAGRTPDGLPYLVMDYVEGLSITEHCRRARLSLRERVELVSGVADGVQHAHQRGVIHRDLKPANVVVSEIDGRARPVVLDFGIAKPLRGALDGPLPPTSGWPVGTPAYMAPEQALGRGPVDTRADVYALGALFYELMAGRPPLPPEDDIVATFERLRDVVPDPPSEAAAAAGTAWDEPRALLHDLDAITLKALEKAPERRYATVAAWRADLARALAAEPIEARPPTWSYRALCFARRRRGLVGALALTAAALLLGLAGLALGLREASRQRREAVVQREAQEAVNRFLTDDLLAAASPEELGGDVRVSELVRRASALVDERFAERPLVAAAVHHALGDVSAALGEHEQAASHLERALELSRGAAGPDAPQSVRIEVSLAGLAARLQDFEPAERALMAAVERARRILGPDDPSLFAALNDLGVARDGLGRHEQAIEAFEEALAGRERLLGPASAPAVATLNNLALAHDARGDSERTLALLLEALERARDMPELSPFTRLGLENNVGATLLDLQRDAEAEPHLAAALEHAREALGEDHPATLTIRANLAALTADLGRPEEAIEAYAEVAERQARLLGPDALDALNARHGLWNAAWKAGRLDEAAMGFEELLVDAERALGAEHWLSAQTHASLARVLADAGDPAGALPHARAAAATFAARFGAEHPRARTASALARELETRLGERPGGS